MRELITSSDRLTHAISIRRQDRYNAVIVREVSNVKARGFLLRRGDVGVESEIAEYEIGTFVAVDVGNGDGVPPTVRCRESCLRCSFDETTSFLMKHTHRHPLSGRHEVYMTVAIVVCPRGGRDHPCLRQRGRQLHR